MLELLESAITSPWVYLALFGIALLDGFFPIVPAETMVITAGVFAASTGEPQLVAVIVVAALGAFVGDHISYQIGRRAGVSLVRRLAPGSRRRAAFDWAAHALAERGGLLLVVARYIPGGRTAATLTAGAVGYPRRRFAFFDAIAAGSWGLYSALVGYIGGAAFEEDTLKGLLLGLGIAAGITLLVEVIRHLYRARSSTAVRAWSAFESATSQPLGDDRRVPASREPRPGQDRPETPRHDPHHGEQSRPPQWRDERRPARSPHADVRSGRRSGHGRRDHGPGSRRSPR